MHAVNNIPTPHIQVKDLNTIASTVIMPGDPLRAKYIAETFLKDPVLFNSVRNILGYTGYYNGKKISVMASGMGMASIGIYSYELFKFYNVDNIIRIGSCGAYSNKFNAFDIVIAQDVWTESTFAEVQSNNLNKTLACNTHLNEQIKLTAKRLNIPLHSVKAHSSDVFYTENRDYYKIIRDTHGCDVVEMEAFALVANAISTQKKATCLLTVTDSLVGNFPSVSIEERQLKLNHMITIALEAMCE